MKLNLACGSNKIPGFINCDVEKSCEPDEIVDFTKTLPYKDNSIEAILLFHAIEHVQERFHEGILSEFHRVLVPEGKLIISYPEFMKCAKNWISNYRGLRDCWKRTIFGRQLYPTDFHISLMYTPEFVTLLHKVGFADIKVAPEPKEDFNTVIRCVKGLPGLTYEDVLRKEIFGN
jgi:SAM-dependent methyltransferase